MSEATTDPYKLTSNCMHCPGMFEVDIRQVKVGELVNCPYCAKTTPVGYRPQPTRLVSRTDLILAYILAVLIPIAGFFYGLWLLFKKEPGHGAACMCISIVTGLLVWAAITMLAAS